MTADADDQAVHAMCALVGEVLGVSDVAPDEDFFELGGTSLKASVLVAQIQRRFDVRLSATDVYEAGTAQGLAARLAGQRPPDAAAPVFLIHWYPLELAREIRRIHPVVLLSYGSDPSEEWPPPVGIEALAAHYVERMRQIRPGGPFHLVGYSLGGIIAWEMARQLEGEVGLLCVIDAMPPEVSRRPLAERAVAGRIARTPPKLLMRKVRSRVIRASFRWPRAHRMLWGRPELRDQRDRLALIDHRYADYRMRPFGGRLLLIEASRPFHDAVLYEDPPPLGQAYNGLGLIAGPHRLMQVPVDHHGLVQAAPARLIADAIDSELAAQ